MTKKTEEKIKIISARVLEDVHTAFKVKAIRKGLKMEQLLKALIMKELEKKD